MPGVAREENTTDVCYYITSAAILKYYLLKVSGIVQLVVCELHDLDVFFFFLSYYHICHGCYEKWQQEPIARRDIQVKLYMTRA